MIERFHESNKLLAHIPADSQTAAQTSSWVSMADFREIYATISVGDLAATATFDAKLRQATDSSGTSAKDISGKAITQLADTDDDKALLLSVIAEELDVDNGFTHVALVCTPATAAVEFGAMVFGCGARTRPVLTTNWTQTVT